MRRVRECVSVARSERVLRATANGIVFDLRSADLRAINAFSVCVNQLACDGSLGRPMFPVRTLFTCGALDLATVSVYTPPKMEIRVSSDFQIGPDLGQKWEVNCRANTDEAS